MAQLVGAGSDPEFFLKKNGVYVASQGIIKGTKARPKRLKHGSFVHRDNIMGELNPTQAYCEDEFVQNIMDCIADVKELLEPFGVEMEFTPFVEMPPEELQHWEAMVFGCDPDYDCWGIDFTPPPDPYSVGNIRSAGGHVHTSWDVESKEDQRNVAKMQDIYLGCGSVLYDHDIRRRQLYGRAGRFRPKPYGVEYRTLSNVWLQHEDLMRWAFRAAVRSVENKAIACTITEQAAYKLQAAINEGNFDVCLEFINKYEGEVPPCLIHTG